MAKRYAHYLRRDKDYRTGEVRWRYGKKGCKTVTIHGDPGTVEFDAAIAEYDAAVASNVIAPPRKPILEGSLAALCACYMNSVRRGGKGRTAGFLALDKGTQSTRRRDVSRLAELYGEMPANLMRRQDVEDIQRALGNGKPTIENRIVTVLRVLFDHGLQERLVDISPAHLIKYQKRPNEEFGWHEWTHGEVAKYEAHWQIGSLQRLALDIMTYLGLRKSDLIRLSPAHIHDAPGHPGRKCVTFIMHKNRNLYKTVQDMLIHPALWQSLQETIAPAHWRTDKPFMLTKNGDPYTDSGFNGSFALWVQQVGLPQGREAYDRGESCSPHGLRKVAAVRLREAGVPLEDIQHFLGHRSRAMTEFYTKGVDKRMAIGRAVEGLPQDVPALPATAATGTISNNPPARLSHYRRNAKKSAA